MKTFFREVLADIRDGRHIDLYGFLLLSIVVAALSAIGTASVKVSLAVVLAGLVALGNVHLQSLKALERLSIAGMPSVRLEVMRDEDYVRYLKDASRVSMLCIANFRFLAANSDSLHMFVGRGGVVREIVMNPDHAESLYVATTRAVGPSTQVPHTQSQIALTIDSLAELRQAQVAADQVQAKKVDYPTSHVVTWFEFPGRPAEICIVPSGFHQRTETRPTLVLREDKDSPSYLYFAGYFENMWKWNGSATLDLDNWGP